MADYAYSNTRIRVMKSLLLKNSDLETLIRTKNLNDCLMSLRQTRYAEIFSRLEKVTIHGIERLLDVDLMRTVDKIIRISPQSCVPFLNALSKRYEFEQIKLILNLKMGNLSRDNLSRGEIEERLAIGEMGHLSSYRHTQEFLSRLIDLPMEDIITLLRERYKGLDGFMPESPDLLAVLIALDRYYFSELQNSIDSLKGADRKVASTLISMEIDTRNVMTILRSVTHGYDAKRFIIPGHDPRIDELGKHTPRDVTDAITKLSKTTYGPLLESAASSYIETNSLLQMELTLRRYLAKESKNLIRGYPFQLGFILGFLKLKELEVENLRAICVGVDKGLSPDEIRELLIMSS